MGKILVIFFLVNNRILEVPLCAGTYTKTFPVWVLPKNLIVHALAGKCFSAQNPDVLSKTILDILIEKHAKLTLDISFLFLCFANAPTFFYKYIRIKHSITQSTPNLYINISATKWNATLFGIKRKRVSGINWNVR